jgi:hypothetical protein
MISGTPKWIDIARFCAELPRDAPEASREAALEGALAQIKIRWPALKIAKQTLRTALLAMRFVDEIKTSDVEYARILERLPAITVETLARWHRYDTRAAKRAAEAYAAGGYSVRSLQEAEKAARRGLSGEQRGLAARSRFEERWLASMTKLRVVRPAATVVGWTVKKTKPEADPATPRAVLTKINAFGRLTIEQINSSGRAVTRSIDCAVVLAGPYADDDVAVSRQTDWMLRALGLTFYFPTVALVVANPDAAGILSTPANLGDRLLVLAPDVLAEAAS